MTHKQTLTPIDDEQTIELAAIEFELHTDRKTAIPLKTFITFYRICVQNGGLKMSIRFATVCNVSQTNLITSN